jgi:hypothetical protein
MSVVKFPVRPKRRPAALESVGASDPKRERMVARAERVVELRAPVSFVRAGASIQIGPRGFCIVSARSTSGTPTAQSLLKYWIGFQITDNRSTGFLVAK